MKIQEILNSVLLSKQWKMLAIVAGEIICGLGAYTVYASRAWSYLSDDPSGCVNCHMPYKSEGGSHLYVVINRRKIQINRIFAFLKE